MEVLFEEIGLSAEQEYVDTWGGFLVEEPALQYKDVDVIHNDFYVSIKDQTRSTSRGFNSVQIETHLYNSSSGEEMQGWWYGSECDFYAWKVVHEGVVKWVWVRRDILREWLNNNYKELREWTTTSYTEEKNRQLNRYFDGARGVVVPLDVLINLGKALEAKEG